MRNFTQVLSMTLVSLCLLLFGLACDDTPQYDQTFTEEEAANLNLRIKFALKDIGGALRLEVKETFVMPRKNMILRLPEKYMRKENLYQRIENLEVNSPGRLLEHPRSAAIRILEFPEGSEVTLKYLYRPDDPISYEAGKETFYAPIIRPDYFQFVLSMVLLYPDAILGDRSYSLELDWDLPSDFKIYNSYGAEQRTQRLTTDFDKMRDAFFVAGKNIRSYKREVRNQPVWITFEGEWENISDEDFITAVIKLLSTQRAAFNDDNFPYFLVNFLDEKISCEENVKFAGTAHPNSFRAIFPGGRKCFFMPEMRQLISHELIHAWIGKKIRVGETSGFFDGKFFSEGGADFFGRLHAVRAGVITEDEYFLSLNRQLEKYYTSPERFVTLNDLVERMYKRESSNRALEDVPYQQGELLMLLLNKGLKMTTSFRVGVEDVIREMLADAEKVGGYKVFTPKELASYFDRYVPGLFAKLYNKIVRGELFIPPDLTNCREPQEEYVTKFLRTPFRVKDPIYFYGPLKSDCRRWMN